MRRLVLITLAALGSLALSCQSLPGENSASLAPVDAGPPAQAVETAEAQDPAVHRVIEHFSSRHTGLSSREIQTVAETIVEEAAANDIEINLVLAVIQVESAGYHRAVSSVGARGLMQIMPATGEWLAKRHGIEWHGPGMLFDPVINVKLGIGYIRDLADRYDHVPTALAAYNWGPGKIDSRIRRGVGTPQLYIEQVQKAFDKVAKLDTRNTAS